MSLSCSELIFKISCHFSRRQCALLYFSFALLCTKSDYLHTGNVYQLEKNPVTFIQVIRTTMHEILSLLVCITMNKIRLLFLHVMCTSLQNSCHFHTDNAHHHTQTIGAVNNILSSLCGEKGCSFV